MPAPDTIDLSGGGVPWPAFTISGATSATGVNTTYALQPFNGSNYTFAAANAANISGVAGAWSIEGSNATEYFNGTGEWPWSAQSWTPSNGAGGTMAFVRKLAAPGSIEQSGSDAADPAELTTTLTGANNDLVFTSELPGRLGNSIRIRYVNPATNNAALSVSVNDHDITVNLATNGSAQITSTASQVKTALESGATAAAVAALVIVGVAAGSDGTGVVTALAWTNLSGGTGGLPLPPNTITL